ncbi:MAG TPA: acyl-CoA dehydrogenase family protein [Solirubrobacteraceae bacterium]|jgi:alkylation response protein AidB-like acyl-CoA dehydrogenase|nr:acyl-CoA dehydrogenase family protein [Solirubrobacteraceae bacterium]
MSQDVQEIAALARELAPETEATRRLPTPLLDRLRASGLMNAGAPLQDGGLELPPGELLRHAATIAAGDASTGWCVSIAATSSLLAGYLEPEGRDELFADPAEIAAGIFAPRGTARPVDGGFVVSGRWPYCSGIEHAGVLFAGCFRAVEGEPDARALPITVGMPREELEVLDTWHTLGLRGTGSQDCVASELFVPARRTFSLFDGPRVDRALYRFPVFGYFALSVAAAAMGNARGAIDDFAELAKVKVGQGSARTLAERSTTHAALAEAEASMQAAEALFDRAVQEAWMAAQDEAPVSVALRNGLRIAATNAARTGAAVTGALFDLAGGPAIYDGAALQRRFRDAHTATAHFQVGPPSRDIQGRVLLDLQADTTML